MLLLEPINEPTAVQPGIGIPASAVHIAQRRCDLAQRCDQIGAGKRDDRRPIVSFIAGASGQKS